MTKYYGTPEQLRVYLCRWAQATVDRVMKEAESGRHTPGTWVGEGDQHHVVHAVQHGLDYLTSIGDQEESLTHMVTRSMMALWSLKHGELGDNGDEGVGL